MTLSLAAALILSLAQATPPKQPPPQPPVPASPTTTAKPATTSQGTPAAKNAVAGEGLRTQVMLDRAGFSPGVIDGQAGSGTKKALAAYQKQGGAVDASVEPLTRYKITPEDAAGPFAEAIPKKLVDQGKLPHLGYSSIAEALAERFHTTPAFLKKLNPGTTFAAGDELQVPNVTPMVPPSKPAAKADQAPGRGRGTAADKPADKAAPPQQVVVTVSKAASALTVTDAASGKILLYAPVTSGSARDPLPLGEWKINGVSLNPTFNYNPDLFWDANPKDVKTKIPPGPNTPVGVVWIDLSKEHYGIHGTPEPSTIGRTQSHGCVRLTNWDALNVAALVRPGTKVVFTQ